jgi:hypothetical protein
MDCAEMSAGEAAAPGHGSCTRRASVLTRSVSSTNVLLSRGRIGVSTSAMGGVRSGPRTTHSVLDPLAAGASPPRRSGSSWCEPDARPNRIASQFHAFELGGCPAVIAILPSLGQPSSGRCQPIDVTSGGTPCSVLAEHGRHGGEAITVSTHGTAWELSRRRTGCRDSNAALTRWCDRPVVACRAAECATPGRPGPSPFRKACRTRSYCAVPGAGLGTLGIMVTQCRQDPDGTFGFGQRLSVRRGNRPPVTVLDFPLTPRGHDPKGLCRFYAESRWGPFSHLVQEFSSLGRRTEGA